MRSNREKSNNAILEKLPFLKGTKIISHFMVAIIFSPTVLKIIYNIYNDIHWVFFTSITSSQSPR